jgi:hypothetical protein
MRAVRAGERLKEEGEGLASGARRTVAQTRERITGRSTDRATPPNSEREKGKRGASWRRQAGPTETEGARAKLGLVGQLGCFLFFFFSEFSNSFSISFL